MKIKQMAAVLLVVSMMIPHMSVQAERAGEQLTASSAAPSGVNASQHNIMNVYCRPSGIAITADGKVLVTDLYNKVVWNSQDGVSTVFAGYYGGGYLDAAADRALMEEPWAVAPFLGGYAITDSENNVVRLIKDGKVMTAAGAQEAGYRDGQGTEALFSYPTGLAADEKGSLYVADTGNNVIRKIDPKGNVTTVVGGLLEPTGLCWKDGALYIADSGNSRIVKAVNGTVTVLAGNGTQGMADGAPLEASFCNPQGIVVGADGAVYVSDTGNGAVRKLTGEAVTTLLRTSGSIEDNLYPVRPRGIQIVGNTLYVCDTFAACVFTVALP